MKIDYDPQGVWSDAETVPQAFAARVAASPDNVAYSEKVGSDWQDTTWTQAADIVAARRAALKTLNLAPGDRVGIFMRNCVDWITTDLAAMSEGLVTVPLYDKDSAANVAHVVRDSGMKLCLIDDVARWKGLSEHWDSFKDVGAVWVVGGAEAASDDPRVAPEPTGMTLTETAYIAPVDDLATIVYTSGTTGPPKGAMLSHRALIWTSGSVLQIVHINAEDTLLSFLPLAHGFERTLGMLSPMFGGGRVAFNRSIATLRKDLTEVRPTVLLAVPRLFEQIHAKAVADVRKEPVKKFLMERTETVGVALREEADGTGPGPGLLGKLYWAAIGKSVAGRVREAFGGRLKAVISGGAPLSEETGRFLMGMQLPIVEGYGLTEAGPAATGSRVPDARIGSVGYALPGANLRVGEKDEIQINSPGLMDGYWNLSDATAKTFTEDGWLRTGDAGEIVDGYIFIRGRIKDIIVLSNGENVNPQPIEAAIGADPMIDQLCVLGDGRPWCSAVVVVEPGAYADFASEQGFDPADKDAAASAILKRIRPSMADIPPFAQVRGLVVETEPWSLEDGLITPTLKVKRPKVAAKYKDATAALYARG
ncbi:MAG: long-chain fatty acid--CoA ligase [Rhodobacteraceae bacterium]|nr:long-chain fatty acid--CoA ligase [Paracoccaceae bacterium]